ncbi:MAG: hypothetical protein KF859_07335 [Phycisphaeraceae bacterium]|nr:hypothetical protein [Phycisphaeraceae bacterium]
MNEFTYIHAGSINNEELFARLGRPYVCEWCGTAKVPERRKSGRVIVPNNEWIHTPLRREEPRWVCISCFLDVYCACNCLDFEANPDRGLVAQVAASEGMTTNEFRRKVWEHQMAVIETDRRAGRLDQGSIGLEQRLKRLLLGEA